MPEGLLGAIDEARGLVPRNAWIRDVLERETLLAAIDPPIRVPEPKPSKAPPVKGGYASSDRKVTDLTQPPKGPAPGACTHPKDKRRSFGWGSLCGVCNERITT